MQEVLQNIAMLDTIKYCQANNIPPNGYTGNGSHVVKYPRRWTYALVDDKTGRSIVTVTYYKNRVPSYSITPKN
jgi:hypothetical protein